MRVQPVAKKRCYVPHPAGAQPAAMITINCCTIDWLLMTLAGGSPSLLQHLCQIGCGSRQGACLQAEKHVSDMVVAAALYAKIDRPAGVVRFAKPQDPDELLNKWSNNLAKLLVVVERSCQQIQKESMVHKVPIGAS